MQDNSRAVFAAALIEGHALIYAAAYNGDRSIISSVRIADAWLQTIVEKIDSLKLDTPNLDWAIRAVDGQRNGGLLAEKQLTKEEAIQFHDSEIWETWTDIQRAKYQIGQKYLCIPFRVFHAAMERTLDRVVFTHEFGMPGCVSEMQADLEKLGNRGNPAGST